MKKMKKMKKLLSAVCAVAMVCGMTVAPAYAGETMTVAPQKGLLNVALAKPVYSSSMYDEVNTSHTYAVDTYAQAMSMSTTDKYSWWQPAADDAAPWIIVDLTQEYMFKRLDFQIEPKRNFIISASRDKEDWTVLHEQGDTDFTVTSSYFLRLTLDKADSYRYVKISRPEGYTGADFKVADICVYAPYHTNQRNVAKGLGVNSIEGGMDPSNETAAKHYSYAYENKLTDGVIKTNFAYSESFLTNPNTAKAYFTIDLGKPYKINYVEISNSLDYNGITKTGSTANNFEIWGANVGGNAETLQADASAEFGGSYKGVNAAGTAVAFGPQCATVRFDTNFTEPKRFIQVAADSLANDLSFGEIGVYTDDAEVETTAVLDNVITGAPPSAGGYSDMDWYNKKMHDGNLNTVWTSKKAVAIGDKTYDWMYYGVQLDKTYNIRKIEVIPANEAGYNNFEIWGGSVNGAQDYDKSASMQILAYQGSTGGSDHMVFDVEVFNNTYYLTFVSKVAGQSFKEIKVWAEKDGTYTNVARGKTAALKAMTNGDNSMYQTGIYSQGIEGLDETSKGAVYPETASAYDPDENANPQGGNSFPMCRYWIDLGEPMRVDFLRLYSRPDGYYMSVSDTGFTVWGSNDLKSGWVKIAEMQTNRPMVRRHSEVSISTATKYRYIGVAKNYNDLKRGYFKGSVYNGERNLNLTEIEVYAKNRPAPTVNVAPLAKVIDPTGDADVAKIFDGNEETAYTGEWAVIDLGDVYTLSGYETVGGGDNLAVYGYTNDVDSSAAVVAGGSYRYIVIAGATALAELKLLANAETVDVKAIAKCKFQDSDVAGGNEIVTLDAATLGADLYFVNVASEAVTVNVAVALYDDEGRLVKVVLAPEDTVDAYAGKSIVCGFEAPSGIAEGYELKAFAWGDGYEPLVKSYSLVQG